LLSRPGSFSRSRLAPFAVVGMLGFVLQLAALGILMSFAHWPWLPATIAAVELAIIHNFVWHRRVTWKDRQTPAIAAFARYNLSTGVASICGNALLMAVYLNTVGLPPITANALAVVTMTVLNFVVADRWVFAAAAFFLVPASAMAAPGNDALEAWNRHVAATESRLDSRRTIPRLPAGDVIADGESIQVPNGTISDWRGTVFIPNITLDDLLKRLQYPGTPPPQSDVISSRVLDRGPDSLRVFIRLVREAIVTVTYDTEHEMRFRRWTPTLATSRSVATRIEEVGGGDRGFLWRLQSYWRYEQIAGGVWVELESLTLSRSVPSLVRPLAAPLVRRIARESMERTLSALRAYASDAASAR
jgi:putative flippase GtrA